MGAHGPGDPFLPARSSNLGTEPSTTGPGPLHDTLPALSFARPAFRATARTHRPNGTGVLPGQLG